MKTVLFVLVLTKTAFCEAPNLHAYFSERLVGIATGFSTLRQVKKVEPEVRGGKLTATLDIEALPSADVVRNANAATYLVTLTGSASAKDQVWKTPSAEVNTTLSTQFRVEKNLAFDGFLITSKPSKAKAETKIQVVDGKAKQKSFATVVAKTKAKHDREKSEAAASEAMATVLTESLDAQVEARLTNGGTLEELKALLGIDSSQAHTFRGKVTSESTDDHMIFHIGIGGDDMVQGSAPQVPLPDSDLGILVHEAALNNAFDLHAGDVITDDHVFSLHKTILSEEPFDLRPHDRTDRWEVKLADKYPLRILFREGLIDIRMRLASWRRTPPGEDTVEYSGPTEIRTRFRLENTPCIRAVRVGDVEVSDGQGGKLDAEESAFLQTKFAAFFAEHWDFDGLEAPKGSSLEGFARLKTTQLHVADRWLKLGWTLR